jgi:hypothetical protein
MNVLNLRQRWAVWVMIAWLATAISVWAIAAAGDRALQSDLCASCRADGDPCKFKERKVLDFELGKEDVFEQAEQSPCIQQWIKASTRADFLLIPSYGALVAFIFLLLSVPRDIRDQPAPRAWAILGILLAVVMMAADITENVLIFRSIKVGQVVPFLWAATEAKWIVLALASGLAGLLASVRGQGRQGWMSAMAGSIAFAGFATNILLAGGLLLARTPAKPTRVLNFGTTWVLPLFLFLILIHAVGVVVKSDPQDLEPPT